MIVRNEEAVLPRGLKSVRGLIDHWEIVDTGSTDGTREVIVEALGDIPGGITDLAWTNFSDALNCAHELARDHTDWLLWIHADHTVEAHPKFLTWLASDPDPDTAAWLVEVVEAGTSWRVPLLVRGGMEWRYVGATHEYLDSAGRKRRPLLGLTLHHHADGSSREEKFQRDLALLAPGVAEGDARAVFYTAETLRFLGRIDEAVVFYEQRARMGGFEEEAWYASYQAAKLKGSVDGLVQAWKRRPWRHEPLSAAARLVAMQGAPDDLLFLEPILTD